MAGDDRQQLRQQQQPTTNHHSAQINNTGGQQQQQQQPDFMFLNTDTIIEVNDEQQCCDPSIVTNSSLSSISTHDQSISTTPSTLPSDINDSQSLLMNNEMTYLQINPTYHTSDNSQSSSTDSFTTVSPYRRGGNTSPIDDTSHATANWSQHQPQGSNHGSLLLQEMIMDYPMNVLSYPSRKMEYEQQIRTTAQEHPEWVNTYNQYGHTPFHVACQTGGIPLQVIEDLLYSCPTAIATLTQPPPSLSSGRRRRRRNRNGGINSGPRKSKPTATSSTTTSSSSLQQMLPLHLACRFGSGRDQYNIIEFLLQMYPDAASTWTTTRSIHQQRTNDTTSGTHETDEIEFSTPRGNDLPIHLYCQNHFCNISVLQLLLDAFPASIRTINHPYGQLPIHMVCERHYFQRIHNAKYDTKTKTTTNESGYNSCSSSDEIIRYFIAIYPQSVTIRDLQRGELPLYTAIRGYQTLSTIQYLLSCGNRYHLNALEQIDTKGRTPLHRHCMMMMANNTHTTTIDERLLSLLLQHDTEHVAGTILDQKGYTPLHYILQRPDVSLDIVYSLVRHYPTWIQSYCLENNNGIQQ